MVVVTIFQDSIFNLRLSLDVSKSKRFVTYHFCRPLENIALYLSKLLENVKLSSNRIILNFYKNVASFISRDGSAAFPVSHYGRSLWETAREWMSASRELTVQGKHHIYFVVRMKQLVNCFSNLLTTSKIECFNFQLFVPLFI